MRFYKDERGSVLVFAVWLVMIFSILLTCLIVWSQAETVLMKRKYRDFASKADFVTALYLIRERVALDTDPYNDSLWDGWYGQLEFEEFWNKRFSIKVEDEESKVNLNFASSRQLEEFLDLFEEEVSWLDFDHKEFIESLKKLREEEKIQSAEELYLIEDVAVGEIEKILPFVTVYPDFPQVNINTAKPIVLKSLVNSLPGDNFVKERLLDKIRQYLEKNKSEEAVYLFEREDLEPKKFAEKLQIPETPQNYQLINFLIPKITTDSDCYNFQIKRKDGRMASGVIYIPSERFQVKVLRWQEYAV